MTARSMWDPTGPVLCDTFINAIWNKHRPVKFAERGRIVVCKSKEGGRGLRTVYKGHCKEERTNSSFVFMLDKTWCSGLKLQQKMEKKKNCSSEEVLADDLESQEVSSWSDMVSVDLCGSWWLSPALFSAFLWKTTCSNPKELSLPS